MKWLRLGINRGRAGNHLPLPGRTDRHQPGRHRSPTSSTRTSFANTDQVYDQFCEFNDSSARTFVTMPHGGELGQRDARQHPSVREKVAPRPTSAT
jgi:hypothetical protein